ncbi:unnamed protein product [Heterobilharzia americana]|nr:unnamed protein product [Heterobilharzia americana]
MPRDTNEDDNWETEPDFVNDVTEKEQRWGSKTVAGSGHQASIDMAALREEVKQADRLAKLKIAPKPSYGYGGKFGVEQDRMDKSAVDWSHIEVSEKHASQKDYAKGFGGKYGVQTDRQDKSAVDWSHIEVSEKHASQKDYAKGFGGKYGVQTDRQDKSAVGWDHKEATEKHPSQKDYSAGFGGKYGVQTDRQDKSALGWDHHEKTTCHPSQVDYTKGFGGKFGLQTDRVDSSSVGWNEANKTELHPSQMKAPIFKPDGGLRSIRQQFEQNANNDYKLSKNSSAPSAAQQRVLEERAHWDAERKQKGIEQPKDISSASIPVLSATTESSIIDTTKYDNAQQSSGTVDTQIPHHSLNPTDQVVMLMHQKIFKEILIIISRTLML